MPITDIISEIDGGVEKNILRYGPMDEDLRFLMHVNNMRLVLISGIMSDRRDEVKEFLRGCTRDELEELADPYRIAWRRKSPTAWMRDTSVPQGNCCRSWMGRCE